MKGINQFDPGRLFEKSASAVRKSCVFISYSRHDRDEARRVAGMIEDFGVDIYFDENDEALQLADETNDHVKVTRCIEDGIVHSSALLGIITERTKESWWVPYEIGSATGHGIEHAHLVTKEVEYLPSYIRASTILTSVESLGNWLGTQQLSKLSESSLRIKSLAVQILVALNSRQKSASSDPIPSTRSLGDLKFYSPSPSRPSP